MKSYYEKKLLYIQERDDERRRRLETGGNLFVKKKAHKGIIKSRNFSLQKTPWYQGSSGERLQFDLPTEILVSDKDEKGYFRFTY